MEPWQIDAVWLSVAFFSGILAKKVNLPPLIGYLATGFLINALGLKGGELSGVINPLAELGVILLLFTIGLKIKVKTLLKREIWVTASAHMLVSTVFFGGFVFLLSMLGLQYIGDLSAKSAALIGFALSFSSTVFVVKILEEKGELNSLHGKIAIGILVIQDIFAVLFISISAGKVPSICALALIPFLYLIRKVLFKLLDILGHGELLTIFGFFATFTVGAFSFALVGLKPDLGALVIGMLLVGHKKSDELYDRMMEFKDFFLIAFFINIGLAGALNWNSLLIALTLLPFIVAKSGLFVFLLSKFNLRARSAFLSSLSLSNYSEFALIVGVICLKMGFIDTEWLVALSLLMALSFLASSPINAKAHAIYDVIQPFLERLNVNKVCQDDEPVYLGEAEFLVIGMGTVGRPAFDYLEEEHPGKVLGMDYGQDRISRYKSMGKNVIWGDSTDSQFWLNADFSKIKLVLFAMSDLQSNVNSLQEMEKFIKRKFKVGMISHYPEDQMILKQLGVDFTYCYKEKLGKEFAEECLELIDGESDAVQKVAV